jgi:Na+/glutamate symporter
MSQKDNFGSGFVLGSIVGGVVGGVLGTLLATRNETALTRKNKNSLKEDSPLQFTSEESMEVARHSLEDKIAQLNLAIDEVRQQLNSVNGNPVDQDRLN